MAAGLVGDHRRVADSHPANSHVAVAPARIDPESIERLLPEGAHGELARHVLREMLAGPISGTTARVSLRATGTHNQPPTYPKRSFVSHARIVRFRNR